MRKSEDQACEWGRTLALRLFPGEKGEAAPRRAERRRWDRWPILVVAACLFVACTSRVDKGDDLMERKDFYGAIAEYRQAIARDATNAEAHAKLGMAYHRVGRVEDAETELRQAVRLAPREAQYHAALGDVLYDLAQKKMPADMDSLRAAREHYGMALKQGEDTAHIRTRIAHTELATGNLKGASEQLHIALQKEPDSFEANKVMGDMYHQTNVYERAEEYYLHALEIDPESINARNNLGLVYTKWKRFEDAIESFESVLEDDPRNKDALRYLANLYWDLGELMKVEEYFDRMLEIDPDDAHARGGKKWIEDLRKEGKLEEESK